MKCVKASCTYQIKSSRTLAVLMLAMLLLAGIAIPGIARAQTLTVLYNFGGVSGDPMNFYLGALTQGRDGNIYGTSQGGGNFGSGAIYKMTPAGVLTLPYSFHPPNPEGGVVLSAGGSYYGVRIEGDGNQGSVFNLAGKQLTTLYSFTGASDGCNPSTPPIQALDGNLYGTTSSEPVFGSCSSQGTVYKLTPSGELTTLYQFDGTEGNYPYAPLVQGTDGNFYGTTHGTFDGEHFGSVFKITSTGVLTTLHLFSGTDGAYPSAPLVQGIDGNFYGTATAGGALGYGVVFKITPAGAYKILHSFDGTDGFDIAGLVQASDGNFYGTAIYSGTNGTNGTIFSVSPQGDFSLLHTFDGPTGLLPLVTVLQNTNGILYGVCDYGGTYNGGVFYSLDVGAPPFVRLLPSTSRVGKTVEILGQGFTGTTSVTFNGISASYAVKSDTFMTAVVPVGATSGQVTVTTPTGTLNSYKKLLIRP